MSSYSSGSSQAIGLEELKRNMEEMNDSSSDNSLMDIDELGKNGVEWSAMCLINQERSTTAATNRVRSTTAEINHDRSTMAKINQKSSATAEMYQDRTAAVKIKQFKARDKVEKNEDDLNETSSESSQFLDLDVLEKRINEIIERRKRHGSQVVNKFSLNDFDLGRVLGHGAFGKVFYAKDKIMNFEVAIKKIEKSSIVDKASSRQVFYEAYIHEKLKHPNIINFLTKFHDETTIYFVLDYAENGTLRTYTERYKRFRVPEHEAAKFTFQVADALLYIHEEGYLYGDLKPENILLDATCNVKLADFGLAFPLRHGLLVNANLIFGGTPEYMAPELLSGVAYDFSLDMWCLGVFIYELLAGRTPFKCKRKKNINGRIINLLYSFPNYFEDGPKKLIGALLLQEGFKRLSVLEVLNDRWLLSHNRQRPHSIPSNETWPYSNATLRKKLKNQKVPEIGEAWEKIPKETLKNISEGKDNSWYFPNNELPELEENSETDELLPDFESIPEWFRKLKRLNVSKIDSKRQLEMYKLQGQKGCVGNNKPGCSHWMD